MNVVISSNYNPLYFQFIPIVCTAWKSFGINPILTLVTDKPEKDWKWIEEFAEIRHYPERNDLDPGIWSKLARFFSYYENLETKQMITDLDLLPLNKEYFHKLYEYKNDILVITDDPFIEGHLRGRPYDEYPMLAGCYQLATGKVWKEIMNPNNLSNDDLINSFKGVWRFRINEDILQPYNVFSEDELMRRLIYNWSPDKTKIEFLYRPTRTTGNPYYSDRVDRGYWKIDYEVLSKNGYVDSHMLRPLSTYKDFIQPLVEYLGIDTKLIDLGIKKYKESL